MYTRKTLSLIGEQPVLVVPFLGNLLSSGGLALGILWMFAEVPQLVSDQIYAVAFTYYLLFSFFLIFSGSVLLEILSQIEAGDKPSLKKSFVDVLTRNFFGLCILSLGWALVLFLLLILQAMAGSGKKESSATDKVVDGAFAAIRKAVRMYAFLINVFISIGELKFSDAFTQAGRVASSSLGEFAKKYLLTGGEALLLYAPVYLFFLAVGATDWAPSFTTYILVCFYAQCVFAFTMMIEQLVVMEIYLWDLRFLKALRVSEEKKEAPPELKDVPQPSLFDDVYDLKES